MYLFSYLRADSWLALTPTVFAVSLFWSGHSVADENARLLPEIPSVEEALTLVQTGPQERPETFLLVKEHGTDRVEGINLSRHFSLYPMDGLDLVAQTGFDAIAALAKNDEIAHRILSRNDLILPPALSNAHVAAGTNYAAHGEEAGIDSVFLFPKFSKPVSQTVSIRWQEGQMLDYEVEMCVRFSKDINDMSDFADSLKAFSLCGDFTDRAELLRRLDPSDVASGRGFTDAKSGENRLPVGLYSVVPKDWSLFLSEAAIGLSVNGDVRQFANVRDMIKPLPIIVAETLEASDKRQWTYKGVFIPLISERHLRKEQLVLTGTPDGVVYNAPSMADKILGGMHWVATFAFLKRSVVEHILERQIEAGLANGKYLKPGDKVQLTSNYLGSLDVRID